MLLFWRYLISNYLKVFALAIFSFIAILLVSRLQEIAQIATMGAKWKHLALFTLYQIPYILPLAVPISCLLSSMLLFQRLSAHQELTALRTGGLSLPRILLPILIVAGCFSVANFFITSELSTSSHLATRKMVYDLTSVNPLVLLQNAKIAKLKNAYVQMDPIRSAQEARNLLIALPNKSNGHLTLLMAKELKIKKNVLTAKKVAVLSSVPGEDGEFDHLIIENELETSSPAPAFAKILKGGGWKLAADHLNLRYLRIRMQGFAAALQDHPSPKEATLHRKSLSKCYSEVFRRVALGLAPLTFTLLGCSFGMDISRLQKKRGVLIVIGLAALTLTAFLIGKAFDANFVLAAFCFLIPQALILVMSLLSIKRISQGIE